MDTGIYSRGVSCVLGYNISLPRTSKNTCHLTSTADMSSLPTVSVETSTASQLWTSFHHWEENASLHESITRMKDFTYTCFAISDGSLEAEKLMFLMWQVATRTYALLEEHLRRDTTMQSKMETLYAEASNDLSNRAEVEIQRLYRSGLKSRVQTIERNFGNWCIAWIPNLLHALSRSLPSTPIGNLLHTLPPMSTQEELASVGVNLMDEMIGYHNLVLAMEHHS